jgi:hypothetical protein
MPPAGRTPAGDRDCRRPSDCLRRPARGGKLAKWLQNGFQNGFQNGLQVLTSGRRAASPRHQSLIASLDWSHALLSEAEQKVFRRLAIFAGGFTLRAAGTIAADEIHGESETLDLVAALVMWPHW